MAHSMVELIERKRDGGTLTTDEIEWIIAGYTSGSIPDYQMSALLMAIFVRSFDTDELAAWTRAMLHSGATLDLGHLAVPKVDKHSTGGVGDKISIPLAPMVAACGVAVPMMSGRGLGHTGGTLDKLESIPGFRTQLDPDEFSRTVETTGLVLAGQSATLVPADRAVYALRDATGTVPSIGLIASSIMSKKLAEDLDALVLDVKVGAGAFMKDVPSARVLAETMVGIGKAYGTTTVAVLTSMDQPLGAEVGNANEIKESLDVLRGSGPRDVTEVTYRLGAEMLALAGVADDTETARELLAAAVASGAALGRFRDVVAAQGGDPAVVDDPALLPQPRLTHEIRAPRSGYVTGCDALAIGRASVLLGGGRQKKEDTIDPAVGITLHAKVSDKVEAGQLLAIVGYNDRAQLGAALPVLEPAWEIAAEPGSGAPLIIGEVR